MRIAYNLPYVFRPGASPTENAQVLRIMLDCLISLNQAYLQNHTVPDLYQSGVIYGRTRIWDPIPALYARGYGDCKSVSAALIAQYRKKGIDCAPVFRWIHTKDPNRAGETDYHILVQTAKGFEDPSKVLGMGRNENARY
jgi:hypothetical protein